jgi:hypothetical protein
MRSLAEAIYAVSYLEWALLGDLPRLSNAPSDLSIEGLSRETMGGVGRTVRHAASNSASATEKAWLSAAADALEEVVEKRNQVVHAHPATVENEQVLYRWATATRTKGHEAHPITETDLLALGDLAYEHLRRMNNLRLPS